MVNMPARCRSCGRQFQDPGGIVIEGGASNIRMAGNITTCPSCGGVADFVEGLMNVSSGGIEMVEGPQWSRDLLEHLGLGLRQILEEEPSDPVIAIEERLPPEFGPAIAQAIRDGLAAQGKPANLRRRRQLAKKVIIGLIAVTGFSYGDAVDNLTWTAQQVQSLLEFVASHGDVPPPPR